MLSRYPTFKTEAFIQPATVNVVSHQIALHHTGGSCLAPLQLCPLGSLQPVWSTKSCVALRQSSTSPSARHCFQNWLKIFLSAFAKNFWMQISFLEVVLFRKCNWRDSATIFYTYHLATIFLCFHFFTYWNSVLCMFYNLFHSFGCLKNCIPQSMTLQAFLGKAIAAEPYSKSQSLTHN